jgi:hypothetical protein
MPAFRFVGSMLLRSRETFLYALKAGPAGGRLRRPSSAGNTSAGFRGRTYHRNRTIAALPLKYT